jgi:hypothetical protein
MRIHQSAITDEKVWIEIGERGAEFFDFFSGSVDLESCEIGEFEEFPEEFADISKVGENAFRADVGLTAKSDVAVAGEIIIQTGRLSGSFLDERRHQRGESFEISFADFEIRMKADGVG